MVSTQKQSGCELDCRGPGSSPALPPQAAASPKQVPVDFAIPASNWQDVDRQFRSLLAMGLSPAAIGRPLKLRQRYGISVRAIVRYARQLVAAGSLQDDGVVHRAGRPHALMPHPTQRLVDTSSEKENPMDKRSTQRVCAGISPQSGCHGPVDAALRLRTKAVSIDAAYGVIIAQPQPSASASAAAVAARSGRQALPVDHRGLDRLQAETFALLRSRLLAPDLTPEHLCKVVRAGPQCKEG